MEEQKLKEAPALTAKVVIVGAGIAGAWLGLKLARAGVETLIVHYSGVDRGGPLGSTARSVGAINTAPIDRRDFRAFMDELGQGQNHPSVVDMLVNYLPEELDELRQLTELKSIKLGVALANGDTAGFLRQLYGLFESHGGRMLDAWVTRIVADENGCQGVQYQQGDKIGKILAPAVVVASGGYAGLFDGSVKTNSYGTMLGRFLQAGGIATNLEFIFKHGYGKPDLGALTPTEELPGAEVYDSDGVHVDWLERELYECRGTENHLEAFKHWRRNHEKEFYIDLKYQGLYRKVRALNAALLGGVVDMVDGAVRDITEMCPADERAGAAEVLRRWVQARERVDFDKFRELRLLFRGLPDGEIFRVRQIAYFSMGGISHLHCATSLRNVFTAGEVMHDFGAHRVGGLPWGLYLSSGRSICEQILQLVRTNDLGEATDFELVERSSRFDGEMLQTIRKGLHRYQERDFNADDADKFIEWIRTTRGKLLESGDVLDDAVAWLIVAEAIMQASLRRVESRGCFYRPDYPSALEHMKGYFSCVRYGTAADSVGAVLIKASELPRALLRERVKGDRHAAIG